MAVVKAIITVVFLIISVALVVVVLLQEGESAGLSSSISGGSGTFWEKNKGRSAEGNLKRFTKYAAILFMILAFVLNIM